jgi:hypothetical protein
MELVSLYFKYIFSASLAVLEIIKGNERKRQNCYARCTFPSVGNFHFGNGQRPIIAPTAECNTIVVFSSAHSFRFIRNTYDVCLQEGRIRPSVQKTPEPVP